MAESLRIGLTLTEEEKKRLATLAKLLGTKPTTLATTVVRKYMESRTEEMQKALTAKAAYDKAISDIVTKPLLSE